MNPRISVANKKKKKKKKIPLIVKHQDLIQLLSKLPTKKRVGVIAACGRDQLNCLSEIFSNFLKRNLTVDPVILRKLQKNRDLIRAVSYKKTSLKRKRSILTSPKGGSILGLLLPLAATVVGTLFK